MNGCVNHAQGLRETCSVQKELQLNEDEWRMGGDVACLSTSEPGTIVWPECRGRVMPRMS